MEQRLLKAKELLEQPEGEVFQTLLREAKQMGFSDMRLAKLWKSHEDKVRALRHRLNIRPVYKRPNSGRATKTKSVHFVTSSTSDPSTSGLIPAERNSKPLPLIFTLHTKKNAKRSPRIARRS
jgi:hypothetical protein